MIKQIFIFLNNLNRKYAKYFIFINIFFIVNALFQMLFVLSFILLVTIFTNPEVIVSNKYFIYFNKKLDFFGNIQPEILISIFFIVVVMISNISTIISNYIKFTFSNIVMTKSRVMLFDLYLRQNFFKILNNNTAYYTNTILSLTERVSMQIIGCVNDIFLNLFLIIFILIPLLSNSFSISIITVVVLLITFISVHKIVRKKFSNYGKIINNLNIKRFEIINESIKNFNEIKLNSLSSFLKNIFLTNENTNNNLNRNISFLSHSTRPILEIFLLLIMFLLFFYYSNSYEKPLYYLLESASFILVSFYRIIPSLNSLYQSFNQIHYSKHFIYELNNETKKLKKNIQLINNKNIELDENINSVHLKNISFSYNQKKLFNNVNILLKKNFILGILGKSGAGKTTFLNIFCGLLKPEKGNFYINNRVCDIYENFSWFKKISYIPQKINVFNTSIEKNIAYEFDESKIDNKKIKECLFSVGLDSLYSRRKNSLDETGYKISGGQMQRLAIARCLYKESEIIVFDEPTSNLDKANIDNIIKLIKKLKRNRILILVSHDLSVLNIADKVINLDKKVL